MNKRKKILGALMLTLSLAMPLSVFASDGGEKPIEKEFSIDVTKSQIESEGENDGDTGKTNEGGNVSEKEEEKTSLWKETEKGSSKVSQNVFEAAPESIARGTVTESVGADNKAFPVRESIDSEQTSAASSQTGEKERPKADKREFMTFTTKSGKVFHLIIDREKDSENVQLVTEVSEQDLLNMIAKDNKDQGGSIVKEKPKKEVPVKKTPETTEKKLPKKENTKGNIMMMALVAAVAGAGYYIKVIKPKKEDEEMGFLDENNEDDDYFSEEEPSAEEEEKHNEEQN